MLSQNPHLTTMIDVAILHAIQGNSTEDNCFKTAFAVSESRATDGCTPESFGRVLTHTGRAWGT